MMKINRQATATFSNDSLNTIVESGRPRDAHKARMELNRRESLKASMTVHRGPLDFDCQFCGAKAGEQCVTQSGNTAKNFHKGRGE